MGFIVVPIYHNKDLISGKVVVWGPCKAKEGECGEGVQTSNRLVLSKRNSVVTFEKRSCNVACPTEITLMERGELIC